MNQYQKISTYIIVIFMHQSAQLDANLIRMRLRDSRDLDRELNGERISENQQIRTAYQINRIRRLQQQIANETDDDTKKSLMNELSQLSTNNQD